MLNYELSMGGKKKESSVITDKARIEEVLSRSIAEVLPSREALQKELSKGKRLRMYMGADATGPQLHLGHATNFILLEKMRRLGHEVIILFGDYTAMIGDPTDKEAIRQPLGEKEVSRNIQTWKDQVSKRIDFDDSANPAIIKRNSVWLSALNFSEVLHVASNFTVQHMLERDMFEKRMKSGKPVFLHEFLYPLMQGYDSVAMDIDVEVGGTDQIFNMLAGRLLQKKYHNREKFVVATTLLENPKTGKKLMSKSEGSYIALDDTPHDMFGKIMALPDDVLPQMFIDTTFLSPEEIATLLKQAPRDAKMRLAKEVVTLYHGEEAAHRAEESFVQTFAEGGIPKDVSSVAVLSGSALSDILLKNRVVESNSEFKRLVDQGAVVNFDEKRKITDYDEKLSVPGAHVFKVGKRRFIRIVVE